MSDQTTIVFGLSLSSVANRSCHRRKYCFTGKYGIGNKASGTGVSFNFERHDTTDLLLPSSSETQLNMFNLSWDPANIKTELSLGLVPM